MSKILENILKYSNKKLNVESEGISYFYITSPSYANDLNCNYIEISIDLFGVIRVNINISNVEINSYDDILFLENLREILSR